MVCVVFVSKVEQQYLCDEEYNVCEEQCDIKNVINVVIVSRSRFIRIILQYVVFIINGRYGISQKEYNYENYGVVCLCMVGLFLCFFFIVNFICQFCYFVDLNDNNVNENNVKQYE